MCGIPKYPKHQAKALTADITENDLFAVNESLIELPNSPLKAFCVKLFTWSTAFPTPPKDAMIIIEEITKATKINAP